MRRGARPRLAPKARLRFDRVRGGWILLAPDRLFALGGSAAKVLEACDGARSVDEIAATLAAASSADVERVTADVTELLEALARYGLVVDAP